MFKGLVLAVVRVERGKDGERERERERDRERGGRVRGVDKAIKRAAASHVRDAVGI